MSSHDTNSQVKDEANRGLHPYLTESDGILVKPAPEVQWPSFEG